MKKTFIFYVLFTLCILIDASENRSGIISALRNNADSALGISKKVAKLSCNSYQKKIICCCLCSTCCCTGCLFCPKTCSLGTLCAFAITGGCALYDEYRNEPTNQQPIDQQPQ